MPKIVKFSKSYKNIFPIKTDFYNENLKNLKKALLINASYKKQRARKKCKNCNKKLRSPVFSSHGVRYTFCKNCNHLNGCHQDTKKFESEQYFKDTQNFYKKNYKFLYERRVKTIYLPKVDFLKSVIREKINLLEIGSGAGHFLKACEIKKVSGIGYESNNDLVKLGKTKLKKNIISYLYLDKTYQKVLESEKNTLVLISVLEHLREPHKILNFFKKSKMKYLYISVPLFSLSALIENSFKSIFPRHLAGNHTHLYTKESLYFLAKKYKFKIIGEWWFGQDFPDLYRSLINSSTSNIKKYKPLMDKYLFSNIDELQNVLDKNKMCSQVHMIFKK